MRVLIFVALLHLLAGAAAMLVARRRRDYLPVAVFLSTTALADIVMTALAASVDPALPAAPLTGLDRVVGHVRQALYLIWPFGFAAMATTIFTGHARLWAFVVAYMGTLTVLVLGYPTISGEVLRRVYLGIELGAIVVATGWLITWASRRESPMLPHLVALLLLSTEFAVLIGPFVRDIFAGWAMGRVMYGLTYLVVLAISGGLLWRHSESDSQSS